MLANSFTKITSAIFFWSWKQYVLNILHIYWPTTGMCICTFATYIPIYMPYKYALYFQNVIYIYIYITVQVHYCVLLLLEEKFKMCSDKITYAPEIHHMHPICSCYKYNHQASLREHTYHITTNITIYITRESLYKMGILIWAVMWALSDIVKYKLVNM